MDASAQDVRSVAIAAIEDFLAGRLEDTLSASRALRAADGGAGGTGRELETLRARDLTMWQEWGFLSHLNAAAVIEEYYGRRIAQARRELRRERPSHKARYTRLRDSYHQLRHERQAVHAWLLDQGWDPGLRYAVTEEAEGVAGHYLDSSAPRNRPHQ